MVAETFIAMEKEVQALPTNYGEYYSDTDWRAQRIDERRLMALYTTSGANASTGLALYEEAVRMSDMVPQGYLRPMVFAASTAQETRGWEDQVLMFVGDVCETNSPRTWHSPNSYAKVAKWGDIHCANSEAELMEAVPEDAPRTMYDEVTVRKGAYVPSSLLALFLDTIQHAMRRSPKSSSIASSAICQIGASVRVLGKTGRRTLQTKA
jgi:hypothetical protein